MEKNQVDINLSSDIKTDRATPLNITLMSRDINNNQFRLSFTNNGEKIQLNDSFTVEVLSVFQKTKNQVLTTAEIYGYQALWSFDTKFISGTDVVFNYVYIKKDGVPIVSADANAFTFDVGLSEIDKDAGRVAEVYDENYQRYLNEFKDNVDFEEIAQAEQERKEAEILRQESYDVKVDTAIVEADVVSKVDNKVTELTPQITNLTAQLAQKVGRGENESISKAMLDEELKEEINNGEIEFILNTSDIENRAVTLPKIGIEGYLPDSFLFVSVEGNRARVEHYFPGDAIIHSSGDVEIFSTGLSTNWTNEIFVPKDTNIVLRAKFSDNSSTVDRISYINNNVWAITPETAVKNKEFDNRFIELEETFAERLENFVGYKTLAFSLSLNDNNRANSVELSVDSGDIIKVPTGFEVTFFRKAADGRFVSIIPWTKGEYTFTTHDPVIFIQARKETSGNFTPDEIAFISRHVYIYNNANSGSATDIIKYVTLGGSDNNTGNTEGQAYATLQKALDDNATTIYVESGIYRHQTPVKHDVKNLSILPLIRDYDSNDVEGSKQLVEFRGSDTLSNWETYNSIYRTVYTNNDRYKQVFIDKTLPVETTTSRPTYNAVLWEGNDKVIDYTMKPVLTLAECETEQGTFFYDGNHVYVNPLNIDNEFNATKSGVGLRITGDNVVLQNIVFDFYTGNPMHLRNIKNLTVQNSEGSHSSTTDGWTLDYTNGTLTKCRGMKNRNDGFNMHFKGDTVLIDCEGMNNFDDGVSHHQVCTGTIIGGRWSGNVKGGIIPVNNAMVNVYNAVIENNRYGFYTDKPNVISQGNLYKGNTTTIWSNGTDMLSVNDVFIENTQDIEGNVTQY